MRPSIPERAYPALLSVAMSCMAFSLIPDGVSLAAARYFNAVDPVPALAAYFLVASALLGLGSAAVVTLSAALSARGSSVSPPLVRIELLLLALLVIAVDLGLRAGNAYHASALSAALSALAVLELLVLEFLLRAPQGQRAT